MKRRQFITLIGGASVWPLTARAQQHPLPVIGFLSGGTPAGWARFVAAFRQGLSDAGFIEGHNVAIEYRWAEGQYDRLPALAADLIQRPVSVIAAATTVAALAAKAATASLPIVFTTIGDPVEIGLVPSLSRPGGNVTGVTHLNVEVGPKLLELVHELIPAMNVIALLVNPAGPNAKRLSQDLQAAAETLRLKLHVLNAGSEDEIDTAFATLARIGAGGLVISGDAFFASRTERLAALALRHAVPSIYPARGFTTAGGLMSYGGSGTDAYHLLGVYTARILKGEKPASLPVQQPTKFELTINLKTATALGLEVPPTLLARADEVIE